MAFGNKISKILDEKSHTKPDDDKTTNNNNNNNNTTTITKTITSKTKSSFIKDENDDEDEEDCNTCELLGVNDKKNQMFQMISNTTTTTSITKTNDNDNKYWEPIESPPTTIELGNSGWTLLHTIAAYYPDNPSEKKKQDVKEFLYSFSKVYPCKVCAKDFREILKETPPTLDSQSDFALWLCNAHNNVNLQLGKPKFNCDLINKRWKISNQSEFH